MKTLAFKNNPRTIFEAKANRQITSLVKIRIAAGIIVFLLAWLLYGLIGIVPRPIPETLNKDVVAYAVALESDFETAVGDYVGANVFARPPNVDLAMQAASRLSIPISDLAHPLRFTPDSLPWSPITPIITPTPTPMVSPLTLWVGTPPVVSQRDTSSLLYPQIEYRGKRVAWTVTFSDEMKLALVHVSSPTILFLAPNFTPGLPPNVRVEQSCGNVLLDRLAIRHASASDAFSVTAPSSITFFWADPRGKNKVTP